MAAAENAWLTLSKNIDAVEEHVLIQEDAPGTHRTMCHFEYKNGIAVNLTFPLLETSVFDTSF